MKRACIAVCCCILFTSGLAHAKVGVVAFEDVLEKTRQGKKINADITAYFKRKQNRIDRRKQSLQTEEKAIATAIQQLQASKTILRKAVYDARKNALEERYRKFLAKGQKLLQDVQNENAELQKKRMELLAPLRTEFIKAVKDIAIKGGYTIIIERSAVYFHQSATDVTDQVVTRVNASTK